MVVTKSGYQFNMPPLILHDDPDLPQFYVKERRTEQFQRKIRVRQYRYLDSYWQWQWTSMPRPTDTPWFIYALRLDVGIRTVPSLTWTWSHYQIDETYQLGFLFHSMVNVMSSTVLHNYSAVGSLLNGIYNGHRNREFYDSVAMRMFHTTTRNSILPAVYFRHVSYLLQMCTGSPFNIPNYPRAFNDGLQFPANELVHEGEGVYQRWENEIPRHGNAVGIDFALKVRPLEWGLSDVEVKVNNPRCWMHRAEEHDNQYRIQPWLEFTELYLPKTIGLLRYAPIPGVITILNIVYMCALRQQNIRNGQPIGRGRSVYYSTQAQLTAEVLHWEISRQYDIYNWVIANTLNFVRPNSLIAFDWQARRILVPCIVLSYEQWNMIC